MLVPFTPTIIPGVLFLEASSLTGENVETPFHLAARSILLAIDSGKLDPDTPGSGISYGDRSMAGLLRGSSGGPGGSRLSGFTNFGGFQLEGSSSSGSLAQRTRGGIVRLKDRVNDQFQGCCNG